MRRLTILIVLILLLIVGGGLTQQLMRNNGNVDLPLLQQTDNPDGDPAQMTGWKAEQLFLVIMFLLFSPFPPGLIPMAIGITVVMWLLDWQVHRAKATKAMDSGGKVPATVDSGQRGVETT